MAAQVIDRAVDQILGHLVNDAFTGQPRQFLTHQAEKTRAGYDDQMLVFPVATSEIETPGNTAGELAGPLGAGIALTTDGMPCAANAFIGPARTFAAEIPHVLVGGRIGDMGHLTRAGPQAVCIVEHGIGLIGHEYPDRHRLDSRSLSQLVLRTLRAPHEPRNAGNLHASLLTPAVWNGYPRGFPPKPNCMNTATLRLLPLVLLAAVLLAACSEKKDAAAGEPRRTPITVTQARKDRVEAVERSVGRLEATAAPALAAETSGRVVRLLVDGGSVVRKGQVLAELDGEPQRLAVASARANVDRLEALLGNQTRTVKRYQELRSKAVSESMLEDAMSQQSARQAELADARARLAEAQYRLQRTQIRSPVDAVVERRLISVGDFVSPGMPVVTIVGKGSLRAVLPFPERLSGQLVPGQAVTLEQPARPDSRIEGTITEVRPMVGTNNRALEVLVQMPRGNDWPPGGTVSARVVIAARDGVVVPTAAVVRRPTGEVVYVVSGDKAAERKVTVGVRTSETAEILTGLDGTETVVLSGAGFLTDGALVAARKTP